MGGAARGRYCAPVHLRGGPRPGSTRARQPRHLLRIRRAGLRRPVYHQCDLRTFPADIARSTTRGGAFSRSTRSARSAELSISRLARVLLGGLESDAEAVLGPNVSVRRVAVGSQSADW